MLEIFLPAFVTFLVIIDPFAVVPIFGALTEDASPSARRAMAVKGVAVALIILFFFALLGQQFLGAIGVSLAALKVAGGLLLFVMALEMVFDKRTQRREKTAERIEEEMPVDDVSVFPIAVPLVAGPGAIATVMLLFGQYGSDWSAKAMVALALLGVLAITLAMALAVGPIMRALGQTVVQVLTRVLGLILAAFAAEFVLGGVSDFFGL